MFRVIWNFLEGQNDSFMLIKHGGLCGHLVDQWDLQIIEKLLHYIIARDPSTIIYRGFEWGENGHSYGQPLKYVNTFIRTL